MQKYTLIALILLVSMLNAREYMTAANVIQLTLDTSLQKKIKSMTIEMKDSLKAQDVAVAIMDSHTGELLSLASANGDTVKEYPNNHIASFSYEPGSIIKSLVFSLALEKKVVNPNDLINGYKGRYVIDTKVITDEQKFTYLSASDVIIYSSNIGMVQIAKRLKIQDYYDGLLSFGLSQYATSIRNENAGSIPDVKRLENKIYNAVASYGYGLRVNLLQLLKAYNVFNNDGIIISPRIDLIRIDKDIPTRILNRRTVQDMKKILIRTVSEGTGKKAQTKGLEIGAKTGTAHIVENGKYVYKFNMSFVGFANDMKSRYTIAVLVRKPTNSMYASETAAIVFKKAVDIMVEESLLKPIYRAK